MHPSPARAPARVSSGSGAASLQAAALEVPVALEAHVTETCLLELFCFQALAEDSPDYWYCTLIAFRWLTNRRNGRHDKGVPSASLVNVLKHFNEVPAYVEVKERLQKRLGKLQFADSERDTILDYECDQINPWDGRHFDPWPLGDSASHRSVS